MTENWQIGGFGLYVHWPFCQAKCPYCDFNSYVSQSVDYDLWAQVYCDEIERYRPITGDRVLRSIFFGGGTPSLMPEQLVEAIINQAAQVWNFANDIEITLEANPTSVEANRFAGYATAGVNRVSIGIQALNDQDLRRLGRLHSVKEALAALETARDIFSRVSFDLIYARQDQSLKAWEQELGRALSFGGDHLSLYQLTIESETAFGDRHARGLLKGLPDGDLGADMYELTQDLCETHGLTAYEVSNHAKMGQESVHNLIYWNAGDYVGIGPGAHGRIGLDGKRYATYCEKNPAKWLERPAPSWEELSYNDQINEFLMMGLRLTQGISKTRYFDLFNHSLAVSQDLFDMGLLAECNDRIFATKKGRLVLNALLEKLIVG